MSDDGTKIYDRQPSEPNDELWLRIGKKMMESSLDEMRSMFRSLLGVNGLLLGVYLAILGFSGFVPEEQHILTLLRLSPLVFWIVSINLCVGSVAKFTEVNLRSPDKIKELYLEFLRGQRLRLGVVNNTIVVGLFMAVISLLVFW